MASSVTYLLLLLTSCCTNPVLGQQSEKVDLQFSYVLSGSAVDPVYGVSLESTVYAVDLALQHINSNSTLLPGYNLNYARILRTECGQRAALDTFFEDILLERTLGVLSCACSQSTLAIAGVINYWNMPQIACNPIYQWGIAGEGASYDHLFHLHPQPEHYGQAVSTFVETFGWRRMSILSQDGDFYREVQSHIEEILEGSNITVIEPRLLQNVSADIQADEFFPEDVRIFFLNMDSSYVKMVLCKAHMLGMCFPDYIWLTYSDEGGYSSQETAAYSDCESGEGLEGLFSLSSTTTSGSDSSPHRELQDAYRSRPHPYTPLAKYAYDSVLTFAALLNKTLAVLERGEVEEAGCGGRNGSVVWPESFTFENELMGCVFLSVLRSLSLEGLTGPITFDSDGERGDVHMGLHQYREIPGQGDGVSYEAAYVGEVDVDSMTFAYARGESALTLFRGPIPLDGTPLEEINAQPLPLIVAYYTLAFLGLVFSTVCLLFNIIFRKRKIVKLTSPNLNYFIISGAVLLYGSVYVRVYFDSSELYNDVRCNLQVVLNCVGYALLFSPILVKMWRVYYIFHNPLPKKKAMKDWYLVLAVSVMVAVILGMSIVGAAVPVLRPDLVLKPDNERPTGHTENGIRINLFAWECYDSLIPFAWVALEYLVLLLFQVAAVVLAFKTRKVRIKELNDSKSVAAIIYITSMVMAALIVITFATDGLIVLAETLFSGSMMLATSVILALLFIPKMVALCKDPEGETVMKSTINTDTTQASLYQPSGISAGTLETNGTANGCAETVAQLKRRVEELERELVSYQQTK